jgi:hypothetical protein
MYADLYQARYKANAGLVAIIAELKKSATTFGGTLGGSHHGRRASR